MRRVVRLEHRFVEHFPDVLDEAVLYISMSFATAAHRCCCGCGNEVITPLSPRDWALTFDGETVTLDPSIGNWSFPCQAHYWIVRGKVRWARRWTKEEIEENRALQQHERAEEVEDENAEQRWAHWLKRLQ